jgi:tRNA A37 threonylcarbamoyladenosine modification protein TsaB
LDFASPFDFQHTVAPRAFQIHTEDKPACEIVLPILWDGLKDHHPSIAHVATLCGPGPFTALRAGQAFAHGLTHGDRGISLSMVSFFDLMPKDRRASVLLDTGGNHWVNALGQSCVRAQEGPDVLQNPGHKNSDQDVILIQHASCSVAQVLGWCYALAGQAVGYFD